MSRVGVKRMRPVILTLIRLGPSWVYVVAMMFVVSTVLLDYYPASPFVWALYLTVLPVMREPMFMLLSVPGIEAWAVVAALALAAVFGVYISVWPQRFLRTRFIHAHVALIALVLANVRATNLQAGLTALSPQLSHWSLTPTTASLLGAALVCLSGLACVFSHIGILRSGMRFAK